MKTHEELIISYGLNRKQAHLINGIPRPLGKNFLA
jgi:hypothetical protein